jgi:hypothetical protein
MQRGSEAAREARWFSVELTRASAPWAFSRGEPYRTIAALELYGTLLCVLAFSDRWPSSSSGRVKLAGTTDNLGNSWILSRLMSTKFPMLLVLGELAVLLRDRNLSLHLEWAPRLQNEEADALTNGDFSAFKKANRIEIDPTRLAFKLLPQLEKVSEELHSDIVMRRARRDTTKVRRAKKVKLKERDPWG